MASRYILPPPARLSTPHGTLGTMIWLDDFNLDNEPFNSTRYIRNDITHAISRVAVELSTPHGTLGTRPCVNGLAVGKVSFNSTRYIRNTGEGMRCTAKYELSTPHGALGTEEVSGEMYIAFNFQLHTVH